MRFNPSKPIGKIFIAAIVGLGLSAGLSACSSTGSSTSATGLSRGDVNKYDYTGEVYLLRGLANVFSTGLDEINANSNIDEDPGIFEVTEVNQ